MMMTSLKALLSGESLYSKIPWDLRGMALDPRGSQGISPRITRGYPRGLRGDMDVKSFRFGDQPLRAVETQSSASLLETSDITDSSRMPHMPHPLAEDPVLTLEALPMQPS